MKDVAHNAVMDALDDYRVGGLVDTEYETPDFLVAIGYPDLTAENEGRLYYLVVNKTTGVIELAESVLVNAVINMKNFQIALEALDEKEESVTPPVEPTGLFN